MQLRRLPIALSILLLLNHTGSVVAAPNSARTCGANSSMFEQGSIPPGGIGGTGHESTIPPGGFGGTGNTTIPPGGIGGTSHDADIRVSQSNGIGGTGHETTIPPGGIGGTSHDADIRVSKASGIGGTGHESTTPPGGIGGTGIMAAGVLVNVNGVVIVEDQRKQKIQLASGDEICLGDRIATSQDSKAKIQFTDGAMLYVLKNTEISVNDYHYSAQQPESSRSQITLVKGDIRSVSGKISKLNAKQYSFSTPAATIRVIGTDFLVTHLLQQEGAVESGTYTKVVSGEVSVQSATSTIKLRAGESSHVMLNGTQSIINSGGGTCSSP